MALPEILEKINKEYASKIAEIETSCENKLKEIEAETQKEIQKIREDISHKTQDDILSFKKKTEQESAFYNKNKLLEEKQNIIKEVFNKVYEKFLSLNNDEYLFFIKQIIFKYLPELKEGEIEIFISIQDKDKINEIFIFALNNEIKDKYKNITFKLGTEFKKISKGIILKKGGIEINESFDSLFKVWAKEFELEILAILFKDTK